MPESRQYQAGARTAAPAPAGGGHSGAPRSWQVLFFHGRAATTLLLWMAMFVEMLLIYVLVNWLPVLLVSKGFSPLQAGEIQILFNIGGMAGNLLFGWLMDRSSRRTTALIMYGCVIVALASLAIVHGYAATALTATGVGLFVIGGQMVLYAMVPIYYPTMMRSTGVGWSVAMGRVGSFAGPVLAGQLLQVGVSATRMLSGTAPVVAVAALAVVMLLRRPAARD